MRSENAGRPIAALTRLLTAMALLALCGCDGAFDCPIDPPACCSNVLFGCGTFDLPQGCSCDNYFGLSYGRAAASATGKSSAFAGRWLFDLAEKSSSCAGAPATVSREGNITESGNRAVLTLQGYGQARGAVRGRDLALSGSFADNLYGCMLTTKARISKAGRSSGRVRATVHLSCLNGIAVCDASYVGTGKRQ